MGNKILIIDDDIDIQKLLKLKLEKDGFNVLCASDPIAGFKEIQTIQPDLILLDVMMPQMTGYEFLKFIQKNAKQFSHIPVIAISARESVENCFNSWDIYEFVKKPIDYPKLLDLIKSALGIKEVSIEEIKKREEIEKNKQKEQLLKSQAEVPIEKKKILIVSSDYSFIEKLRDLLEELGFAYQDKDGGKETLPFLDLWKPDILLGHYSDTTTDIDFQSILLPIEQRRMLPKSKIAIVCPPTAMVEARKEFKGMNIIAYEKIKDLSTHIIELAQ